MRRTNLSMMILTALFAALTAIGAFLQIPLGSMSITLQFFFTAMAGILLGPKWGAMSQIVYVILGLVGLPVFIRGGGPAYVLQPSFGFLLSLIPSAWCIGLFTGDSRQLRRIIPACVIGDLMLYLIGLPYMYLILNLYLGLDVPVFTVATTGMLIYLPGDVLKITAVCVLASALLRVLPRSQTHTPARS